MRLFFKLIAVYTLQIIMRILRIFPMKKNRIVFICYTGEQYSCNPRYIAEYLAKMYSKELELVWLLKHPEQYEFLKDKGMRVVSYGSFKKLYYGLTAKVNVINAGRWYSWMPPRKEQINIDTWHGGGYYKLCGLSETRKDKSDKRLFLLASKNTTFFLSTNECFTENEIRKDFGFEGEVLNIGYPRNDIFFREDLDENHRKVCQYFGINENCKILFYAPTFRYNETNFIMPDFEELKKIAEKCFGGEWVVLTRMHYYSDSITVTQDIYDANYTPNTPEMQELLAACDMLISDYSSCIWDYSFTYRPCFLFTPDLDEYTENRGFGIDIYDWGFPVCKTEQELWDAIEHFNADDFRKAMERHHDNLGSFEHGNATEIMGKLIYDFCFPEQFTDK